MMDIRSLPDAWGVLERLGGKDANEKDNLYDIYYQLSTAIFDYRLKHKMSQKKLAEKLGVSQPMIVKLESGDYNYTIEQLWKIANKLQFEFNIYFRESAQDDYSVFSRPQDQEHDDYGVSYLMEGA